MKEIKENIWYFYNKGAFVVIPTNGFVKNNGECVMGRGLALQAKTKFPEFAKELGTMICDCEGQFVFLFKHKRMFTFPVKHKFWEKANLKLIEKSCKELVQLATVNKIETLIYLPTVGCGNGKLSWEDVKLILEKHLDDKFVVCDLKSEKINGGT